MFHKHNLRAYGQYICSAISYPLKNCYVPSFEVIRSISRTIQMKKEKVIADAVEKLSGVFA